MHADIGDQPAPLWPEVSFDELSERLKQACGRAGWKTLMPVQARSMAVIMKRQDVMVQARTGSGKTGAFILPLLERIDPKQNYCQALVLLPTRELAKQVAQEAEILSGGTIRTVPVYGGVGYGTQVNAFNKGAHLVVGTPGRILDHLMRGSLCLDQLDTLVFDEADRMLSIGFFPDMQQLQTYLPKQQINSLMFSATFPPMVLRLAEDFLSEPQFISLSQDHVHVAEVSHVYYQVPPMGKERVLTTLIEVENPSSAIIFTNTKANCNFVAEVLKQFGYNAAALSSDLSQSKREKVLNKVRQGKIRFLVATDVAARGIDIPELSHVFLYEPPEDKEAYIHRSGRTGRAGAAGEVISLVDLMQKMELKRIGEHFKIPLIQREIPEANTVCSIVAERTTALLEAEYRRLGKEFRQFVPLVEQLALQSESLAQLAMLLDEFYHAHVHGLAKNIQAKIFEDEKEPDFQALSISLSKDYKLLKPLSRERLMKFLPLAKDMHQEDNGKNLLSMLLAAYYFRTVYTPLPKKVAANSKKQAPKSEHPLLKSLRSMRPPSKKQLAKLLPLAQELGQNEQGIQTIAILLHYFENNVFAEKAQQNTGKTTKKNAQENKPQSRTQDKTLSPAVQEDFVENTFATPPTPTESPVRKKRPRRRRRKKKSSIKAS